MPAKAVLAPGRDNPPIIPHAGRMILGLRFGRGSVLPPEPQHIIVRHAGATYRVFVRRMAAARRFTLRISAATGGVVLTLPKRADLDTAADFARRNGGWIA